MATHRGSDAEALASRFLQTQGLRLLERNVRCRRGEIDLVMRDGDTLVFVEVRQRSRALWGSAAESITAQKRRKLSLAAQEYLQKHPTSGACRFDVVAIDADNPPEWIPHAFEVTE